MLLKAYCSSYYGCELWDLSYEAVDDFCIMWRKALKRLWGLSRDSFSLAPLYATNPIMDELCSLNCSFINARLSSDWSLISFVARQSIFNDRMASPLEETHTLAVRDMADERKTFHLL